MVATIIPKVPQCSQCHKEPVCLAARAKKRKLCWVCNRLHCSAETEAKAQSPGN
jgi:hypothetical protein